MTEMVTTQNRELQTVVNDSTPMMIDNEAISKMLHLRNVTKKTKKKSTTMWENDTVHARDGTGEHGNHGTGRHKGSKSQSHDQDNIVDKATPYGNGIPNGEARCTNGTTTSSDRKRK